MSSELKQDTADIQNCKKCEFLMELFKGTPMTNRDYWVMTELFVMLHNGDICRGVEYHKGKEGGREMIALRCPVCNGNGLVPNGFYRQTSGHWSSADADGEMCHSCLGKGYVLVSGETK